MARPAALGAVKALSLLIATIAATTVPMFAGAVDGTAHRLELLAVNSRALGTGGFLISPAANGTGFAATDRRRARTASSSATPRCAI